MNDAPWGPIEPRSTWFDVLVVLLLLAFILACFIAGEALRAWVWKAVWS